MVKTGMKLLCQAAQTRRTDFSIPTYYGNTEAGLRVKTIDDSRICRQDESCTELKMSTTCLKFFLYRYLFFFRIHKYPLSLIRIPWLQDV